MKKTGILTFLGLCVALAGLAAPPSPVDCVDTRIGGSYRGHTFPGAAGPFALVQASPDTGLCDWDHCSGYVWEDPFVYGFSQTHLSGTGCPDLADVRLLPFTDDFADPDPCSWKLAKDARTERGRPGLYTVAFTNAGVTAELTATPRVGVHRYAFAPGRPVKLLVDLQWVNAHNMRSAVVWTPPKRRWWADGARMPGYGAASSGRSSSTARGRRRRRSRRRPPAKRARAGCWSSRRARRSS